MRFKACRLVPRGRFRRLGYGLLDARGGAALVEFALAIVPVNLVFFGMVQWCIVQYVHLIVKHAAFVAVRCYAVTNTEMLDAGTVDDCTNAAQGALQMLFAHVAGGQDAAQFEVSLPEKSGPYEQKIDTVLIKFNYKCSVPLGRNLVCNAGTRALTESASFPNQGSAYSKIWPGA